MKLKDAVITILVGRERTTIELYDRTSCIRFVEITMTPEQLSSALSRLAHTPCEIEVNGIENVNKKREMGNIIFPKPEMFNKLPHDSIQRNALLKEEAEKHTPAGWTCSGYFGSRDNFFTKDGIEYVRVNIFRWVDLPEEEQQNQ